MLFLGPLLVGKQFFGWHDGAGRKGFVPSGVGFGRRRRIHSFWAGRELQNSGGRFIIERFFRSNGLIRIHHFHLDGLPINGSGFAARSGFGRRIHRFGCFRGGSSADADADANAVATVIVVVFVV